jgi:hypothetical protein
LGRMYQAVVTEAGYRKHKCQHCGQKFAYIMARTAWGTGGTGFAGTDDEAVRQAKREAQKRVREMLRNEFECVPCLNCGEFQDEMIAELKRKATRGRFNGALALAACALPALFVAAVFTAAMLNAKNPTNEKGNLLVGGAWVVAGLLTLAAGAMFTLWWQACKSFDPYGGRPLEFWKARARKLGAITPEELEVIERERREMEEEDAKEGKDGPVIGAEPEIPEAEAVPEGEPWEKGNRKKAPKPAAPTSPPPAEKNPFDFG